VNSLIQQQQYEQAKTLAKELLAETYGRHQSSKIENGIIRKLAKNFSIPLADIESAVEAAEPHGLPGETLFGDHCHLNNQGNQILLSTFLDEIKKL
jgi:hypothetical protein